MLIMMSITHIDVSVAYNICANHCCIVALCARGIQKIYIRRSCEELVRRCAVYHTRNARSYLAQDKNDNLSSDHNHGDGVRGGARGHRHGVAHGSRLQDDSV